MANRTRQFSVAAAIRTAHEALVLEAIRAEASSRAELVRRLGLSRPTIAAIVDDLVARGVIREGAPRPGRSRERRREGPGRPPVELSFDARSAFVIGIHVGVAYTTIALADAAGVEIARRRIPTPRTPAEQALRDIGALARELVVGSAIPRRRLAAAAVVVPGAVDVDAGACLHAPNLGWREVPIAGLIGAALGIPVVVHNAVHAAALAEQRSGAAAGARCAAIVYAGTGVGAAIVEGGDVLRGAFGMTGELGHAMVPGLDTLCACGRHGCVETAASAPAVARAARDAVRTGAPTRMAALGDGITALDVHAAAEAGDTLAQALLGEAGRTLGIAASWLVDIANPDVLVLGGGLVGAGAHFIEPFTTALEVHAFPAALARLRVTTWSLGAEGKVTGAIALALDAAAARPHRSRPPARAHNRRNEEVA